MLAPDPEDPDALRGPQFHAAWADEFKLHNELFTQLAYHMPQELVATKDRLQAALV